MCPGFHHLFKTGEILEVSSSLAEVQLEEAVTENLLCIVSGMVGNPSQSKKIFGTKVMNHSVKVQQQLLE